MIIKFPKGCPPKKVSFWKRYWKTSSIKGSTSLKAAMTFLKSPGGRQENSFRKTPLLPPLSATVTMVVISTGRCFNPRSKTEIPLPPPNTTILGCFLIGFLPSYLHFISRIAVTKEDKF